MPAKKKPKKQEHVNFAGLSRSEVWEKYGRAIALLREGVSTKELVWRSKINNWRYPVTASIAAKLKNKYAK